MRKIYFLLSIMLSFIGLTTKAQTTDFTLGYVSPNANIQEYSGIGNFERLKKIGVAFRLPASLLRHYVGSTMKSVSIGWSTKRQGSAEVFVTHHLGQSPLSNGFNKSLQFGWNTISLQKTIPITENMEDIFVGYYTKVGPKEYPIAIQPYGKNPNGIFAWQEGEEDAEGHEQWGNHFKDLSMPYIVLNLSGDKSKLSSNVVILSASTMEIQYKDNVIPANVLIHNYGIDKIDSIEVETTFGSTSKSQTVIFEKAAPATREGYLRLPLNVLGDGMHKIRFTKVNGQPNKSTENYQTNIFAIDSTVAKRFIRRPLLEVFTWEEDYRWPRINKNFFEPSIENYKDKLSIVIHHMGDQFMIKDNEAEQLALALVNNDSTQVVTPEMSVDRTYNPEFKYASLSPNPTTALYAAPFAAKLFDLMAKVPTFVSVNLSATFDASEKAIKVDVSGEVDTHELPENEKLYLTVYLIRNGVKSNSQAFGKEDEKETFIHNYMVANIPTGVFGDQLEITNDTYHRNFTILPKKSWDLGTMQVVAFVSRSKDNGGGHMQVFNSAEVKLGGVQATQRFDNKGTSIVAYIQNHHVVLSGKYDSFVVYNISGEQVANENLAPGVYIVKISTLYGIQIRKVCVK